MPSLKLSDGRIVPVSPEFAETYKTLDEAGRKKAAQQVLTGLTDEAAPAATAPAEDNPDWQQPKDLTLAGVGKAGASGVRTGVEGTLGAPRDMSSATGNVVADKVRDWTGSETAGKAAGIVAGFSPLAISDTLTKAMLMAGIITPEQAQRGMSPGAAEIGSFTDQAVEKLPENIAKPVQDITRHEPQNVEEEFANTIGTYVPDLLFPGGAARRAANVVVPAVATEGAGQVARGMGAGPGVEDAIRTVVSAISGGGSGVSARRAELAAAAKLVDSTPGATARVEQLMRESGMTPEQFREELNRLGPSSTPADTSSVLRQEAQRIQATPGPGREIIDRSLREREAAATPRLEEDIRATMTPAPVGRQDTLAALKERQADISTRYDPAHASQTAPANLQPIDDAISAEMARTKDNELLGKLNEVREKMRGPKPADGEAALETGSSQVHEVRKAIDGMLRKSTGEPRDISDNTKRVLSGIRTKLDEEIGTVNPAVKEVDVDWRQTKQEEKAFKTGEESLSKERTALSPEEFQRTFDAMTPGERTQVQAGLSREIDRLTGVSGNDRVRLKNEIAGEGGWNHQKIATIVGREKADQLMRALEREKVFNETYNKVVQGSKTAETEAAIGAPRRITKAFKSGGITGGLASAIEETVDKLLKSSSDKVKADVAPLLVSGRHDDLFNAIKRMQGASGQVVPRVVLNALLARQEEIGNR